MSDDVLTFGFEKDDIRGGMWEKYKGKKNEVHRAGIVFTDPKALFAGAKIHYKDRFFLCKHGVCCDKLGSPKYRIGCVLIKYSTDKSGVLNKPLDYTIYPWLFSEPNFLKLKTLNNEFPLTTHDVTISCSNEEYQHLDITPCKESVWHMREELTAKVLEDAKPVWDYVKKSLASDLSVEEIKDLLSMGSPAADPSTKMNLDDVLSAI
jgi:hypothetical protein